MDPFTITVGTITLITSVKKTLEVLKKLLNIRHELDALIQDTSDLELVLEHVATSLQSPISSPQDDPESRQTILQLVEQAKSTLSEINDVANIHISFTGSFKSLGNHVKMLSQLNAKRQDLHTVRSNLTSVLLIVSSFRSLCIESRVVESGALQQELQKLALNVSVTQDRLLQSQQNFQSHAQNTFLRQDRLLRSQKDSQDHALSALTRQEQLLRSQQDSQDHALSALTRQEQLLQSQQNFQSHAINAILRQDRMLQIICEEVQSMPKRLGLQFCNITLRACRVVSDSEIIFRYAIDGNLRGIKMLFDAGSASAYDVDASTGTSALVYATDRGHIDVWKFLLQAGADRYQETKTRHSPMDVACGRILGETASPEITAALVEDFDVYEYLEERKLPALHRLVLGLTGADLEAQLQSSTRVEINALDYQGRTALAWAAIRGDTASLKVLLKYGANPNIAAYNGDSPLHHATRAPGPGCIRPLLNSGADVNAVNAWNVNPLAYTTAFRDDLRYLEPLLEMSVDMHHEDKHARSALMRAVLNNRPKIVKCLLAKDAKLTKRDAWGSQPLTIAIERKFHELVHIILENVVLSEEQVSSILELAMVSGDSQTVDIIEGFRSHVQHFNEEDRKVLPAVQSSEDLETQNDAIQHQQAARARTTGFQALDSAVPVLVSRKGKAKIT